MVKQSKQELVPLCYVRTFTSDFSFYTYFTLWYRSFKCFFITESQIVLISTSIYIRSSVTGVNANSFLQGGFPLSLIIYVWFHFILYSSDQTCSPFPLIPLMFTDSYFQSCPCFSNIFSSTFTEAFSDTVLIPFSFHPSICSWTVLFLNANCDLKTILTSRLFPIHRIFITWSAFERT